MSLLHALFVPKGAVTKSGFAVAAAVLIALGVLVDLGSPVHRLLAVLGFFVNLVLTYCWVALWIKRFHAAGTSGWWTVLVVLGWLIVLFAAIFAVLLGSGLDLSLFADGDQAAAQAAMEEIMVSARYPILIVSTVISAIVAFGLNAMLPAGRGANHTGESEQNPPSGPSES